MRVYKKKHTHRANHRAMPKHVDYEASQNGGSSVWNADRKKMAPPYVGRWEGFPVLAHPTSWRADGQRGSALYAQPFPQPGT